MAICDFSLCVCEYTEYVPAGLPGSCVLSCIIFCE